MFSVKRRIAFTVLVAGLLLGNSSAWAQFDPLIKWVPDSANTIMMVQAKRIFDSPLSKSEGWRKDQIQAFKSGASFFPATSEQLVIASQVDFQTMQPMWKVTVLHRYGDPVNVANIAGAVGGVIDNIAGMEAVTLPNDTYIIKIDDGTIAAMTPANRQTTTRWLQTKGKALTPLAPYLQQAVQFADRNADIIIAIDATDVLQVDEIAKRLEMNGVIMDQQIAPAAGVIATMQGLTLGVTVRDKIFGSLKIDFGKDTGPLAEKGKALVLDALAKNSVMIDDIKDWNFEQSGMQLKLSGPLTENGLRDILMLARHSIQHDLVITAGQGTQPTDEQALATNTKIYFDKVQSLFSALKNKPDNTSMLTYAKWFERYANEIDQMSVLNLDPDMEKYGLYVSTAFRDVAAVCRGANLDKKAQLAGTADEFSGGRFAYGGGYGYGYGGVVGGSYFYMNDRSRERRAIGTQIDVEGEKKAREILAEVQTETSELRRAMTQKYQIGF